MSRSVTCLGIKTNGKMKILDREGFDATFAEFGEGEEFNITLEEVGRKRTNAQNRFFHGPVLKAFMALGNGKQEAKDMLCLMFIPHDIHMLDGSIVRVPGHTAALSVEDFNDLIENCIRLAAENGQNVKDADEWRSERRRAA